MHKSLCCAWHTVHAVSAATRKAALEDSGLLHKLCVAIAQTMASFGLLNHEANTNKPTMVLFFSLRRLAVLDHCSCSSLVAPASQDTS